MNLPDPSLAGLLRPMPRRLRLDSGDPRGDAAPPMAHEVRFRAGLLRVAVRAMLWGFALLRFVVPTMLDFALRRGSVQRRARRLRLVLQSMGPSFHKVGQQLSVRADILPYEYCRELGHLLDDAEPMPLAAAIRAVERSCGGALDATFSTFDPEPIGSASVACVYQATLRDGREVAVKVRRPGIGPTLVADLRVLGILAALAEQLTLVKEGTTRNLRQELGSMLLEELDFEHEARNVELFCRSARKCRLPWLSAPAVLMELSDDQVLVTGLVHAVPLTEILAAKDQGDEVALSRLRESGIDPGKLARRLMRTWHWEVFHFSVFHADPHPANVFVLPGNELVLIDFGSCGRVSLRTRELTRRINACLGERDAAGGAETAIKMLEPLPPIDVDAFSKELEQLYWSYIRANASKHAEWWEKSSGRLWMRFAGLARKWGLPVNLDTLRLFRATFLFDTIVMRLDPTLDMPREFRRFLRSEYKRRRRQVRKRLRAAFADRASRVGNLDTILRVGARAVEKIDDAASVPGRSFSLLPGRVAQVVVSLVGTLGLLAATLLVATNVYDMVVETDLDPDPNAAMFLSVLKHPVTVIVSLGGLLIVMRKAKERLSRIKL